MNQIQINNEECKICHECGNDVNVSYGDYDFVHQKCLDVEIEKHERHMQSLTRIEPVLEQLGKHYLSNDDLKLLKNEIDSIIFERSQEQNFMREE